jgi:hypothetical protein
LRLVYVVVNNLGCLEDSENNLQVIHRTGYGDGRSRSHMAGAMSKMWKKENKESEQRKDWEN